MQPKILTKNCLTSKNYFYENKCNTQNFCETLFAFPCRNLIKPLGRGCLIALFFAISLCVKAQVTIGALDEPAKGTLLDLNPPSATIRGGLLLPNVFITNRDSLPVGLIGSFTPAELDVSAALRGLVVYNYNADIVGGEGEGVYIWDGNVWRRTGEKICKTPSFVSYSPSSKNASTAVSAAVTIAVTVTGSPTLTYQWYSNATNSNSGGTLISGETGVSYTTDASLPAGTYYYYCVATSSCDGSSTTSAVFTVTVNEPSSLPTGSGTFSGRTCFDVAKYNDGDGCGDLASRQNETLTADGSRADFTNTITNTQTYTFTPSGTVSNVFFMYKEASSYTNKIIESMTGGNTGNSISSDVTCTVVYKSSLNTDAATKTSADALTVDIYAIYNDAADYTGSYRAVKLTASIKDCSCCPGLLIPGGEYSDIAMGTSLPSGATTNNTNGSAGEALRSAGLFTATGKSLCYYYRDYSADANANSSSQITWNDATDSGADMSFVCGASDGKGVDVAHSASAWRLPVLFELAQIGELASNNATGPSGTITKAMVNAAMTYTNGTLPAGSDIIAATVYNIRLGYNWSSTQSSSSLAWTWLFNATYRHASSLPHTAKDYVRCVRSY